MYFQTSASQRHGRAQAVPSPQIGPVDGRAVRSGTFSRSQTDSPATQTLGRPLGHYTTCDVALLGRSRFVGLGADGELLGRVFTVYVFARLTEPLSGGVCAQQSWVRTAR